MAKAMFGLHEEPRARDIDRRSLTARNESTAMPWPQLWFRNRRREQFVSTWHFSSAMSDRDLGSGKIEWEEKETDVDERGSKEAQ